MDEQKKQFQILRTPPKTDFKSRLRLFCFHHLGDTANPLFRGWQDKLSPLIEVCPVQVPEREQLIRAIGPVQNPAKTASIEAGIPQDRINAPPYVKLKLWVESLAAALTPVLSEKPFAFFGHRFGALVGFELSRCLRKSGSPLPYYLFFSGQRAPQLEPRDPFIIDNYRYSSEPPLKIPISIFGGLHDLEVGEADFDAWRTQADGDFSIHMFSGVDFLSKPTERLFIEGIRSDLKRILL